MIYGPKKLTVLEVKATKEIKNVHLSGLKSFGEDYPTAEKIFIYMGTETRIIDGIKCMPLESFLKGLMIDS